MIRRLDGEARPVATVIVPVFNGFEATRRCLDSLARHATAGCDILLIDDGSVDPRVMPLLSRFVEGRSNAALRVHDRNLGFVAAVNAALACVPGDVAVLNSDTQVSEGWLGGLLRCRDSDPAIGVVCPLSNNATILSIPGVPELFGAGDEPDVDAIAACVRRASQRAYPRLPTAVGFCMLLTRRLIEATGGLDPAYGRGYGEECDLSMRALDLGFEIACCDDVYVHHHGSASFAETHDVEALRASNQALLERRWPRYPVGVSAWSRANPLRATAERINAAAERDRNPGRPRVLQVLHGLESRGGIEEHTRALINHLRHEVTFTVAYPQAMGGSWSDFAVERLAPHLRLARLNPEIASVSLEVMGHAADCADASVEAAFANLLAGDYDVVHFQSLLGWNSLALPRLARACGSRVVISAHDYWFLCPDYNLMAGVRNQPCGRVAARGGDAGCVECLRAISVASPRGSYGLSVPKYLEQRFARAAEALAQADAIVCPSGYVRARFSRAFGEEIASRSSIIGHGVEAHSALPLAGEASMLRVAMLGRFTLRKGAGVLIEAARRLAGQRIVLECWGSVDSRCADAARAAGILLRGSYRQADLPKALLGIDLVVVPAVFEETFCLTVSEAQRLGIPVAASAIGAIPERIRDGENGFLLPPGDVEALVALLLRLRGDRRILGQIAERLRTAQPKAIADNAAEYLALYRELAGNRIARPGPVTSPADTATLPRRLLGFPRRRRHTALGDDDYDAWLATRPVHDPASAAGDFACHIVVMPGSGPASALQPLATSAGEQIAVTELEPDGDEQDATRRLNIAIAGQASRWIVLVQSGDMVEPHAIAELAGAAAANPRALVMYCDHDAISVRRERYDPVFKPGPSPELLRTHPYVAGLCALDREELLRHGGLRAPGWAGVVEFVQRLVEDGHVDRVVALRAQLVHRSDLNVRARRERARPVRGSPARFQTLAALVRPCGTALEAIVECLDSMLRSSGGRINELHLDAEPRTAKEVARVLESRGHRATIAWTEAGRSPLGSVLRNSSAEWIVAVEPACANFRRGWLEHLEAQLPGQSTAAIAPRLRASDGEAIAGWEVVGGGAWAIAGSPPVLRGASSLVELYSAAREVSLVSGRLALIRRGPCVACVDPGDLDRSGRFDLVHACLALRKAGFDLIARPEVAADYASGGEVPPVSLPPGGVPADVSWMRDRWQGSLADDPFYHPALALTGDRFGPALTFPAPEPSAHPRRVRICAFPFDAWGSGELRVRQPCAALERSGRAHVLMMREHHSGHVPNQLEWRRLGADTLYAHNFLHAYQLEALEEYARHSGALRVLGFDDLLDRLPPDNPFAATIYPDIAHRIARAVELADRLVVSTAELAEAYGKRARRVLVVPNAIDESRWRELRNRPRGGPKPRVGWAGARQHAGDLRLLEPVVRATHLRIDWVFLGMCPHEIRPLAAEVHDMVPIGEYPARLASLGLDAAVAPLEDNPFNRSKSNLKLLEYGILGLPVVASDIEPYRNSPARLVGAHAARWVETLLDLVRDRDVAAAEGQRLRDWVLKGGTLNGMLPRWGEVLTP